MDQEYIQFSDNDIFVRLGKKCTHLIHRNISISGHTMTPVCVCLETSEMTMLTDKDWDEALEKCSNKG